MYASEVSSNSLGVEQSETQLEGTLTKAVWDVSDEHASKKIVHCNEIDPRTRCVYVHGKVSRRLAAVCTQFAHLEW